MIEKICAIKNVGRFVDYAACGEVTFRKVTLVHSENGRGKTMISAILRSLRTSDPNPILARTTLGDPATGGPELHLRVDGQDARYRDGGWNLSLLGLRVFDSSFVHENVYAGSYVDHQHKKKHYQFVVGERGKVLAERVRGLDGETRRLSTAINEKEADVRRHVTGALTVQEFISLSAVPDIDNAIAGQRRTCESLAKAQEIADKSKLSQIALPTVDLDDVEALLSSRLADVAEDAERVTREHIARCMDERGEAWTRQGLSYLKEEKCPFCAQSLERVDLIAAYRTFFGKAYDEFKAEVVASSRAAVGPFSEDGLLQVQQTITTNEALADFWRQYVDVALPKVDFESIRRKWIDVRSALEQQLSRKVAAPLETVPFDPSVSMAVAAYEEALTVATSCNTSVQTINLSIEEKKDETAAGDLAASRLLLGRLVNTKARHLPDVEVKCSEYQALVAEKRTKEVEKDEAKQELDAYAEATFAAYEEAINRYLQMFGAGFRIVNVRRRYAGGSPSSAYQIEINSAPVDVGDEGTPPDQPCFGTTLSDGDRSTLAFAFFLARLDQDEDLDSQVVVFDDPISSLDGHRRTCTQQQMARICHRAKQVIVMSHDPYFLRMIWEDADKPVTKTLHIVRREQESAIAEWDIERETRGEYFQNYCALVEYVEHGPSGDLREVARCIRPILEGNLRIRFPGEFGSGEWLGEFIGKIRDARPGDPLLSLQPHLGEFSAVNDFSKKYHHCENPDAATEPILDGELRAYVERTLNLLHGIFVAGAAP